MLIGLVGTLGSGKGIVRELLEERGFEGRIFSNVLKEELIKRGMEVNRENLQDMGNEIRNNEGTNALAKKLIESLDLSKDCFVDGIRNPGEIEELKANGFVILSIDAPREIRFKRMLERRAKRDPKSWDEFLKIEKRDLGEEDKAGQQVSKCMEMADFKLINDLDKKDLNNKITEFLEKIKC